MLLFKNKTILKLSDFGLARKSNTGNEITNLTIQGGTKFFMSPSFRVAFEAHANKIKINPEKHDVYAVGVIVCLMIKNPYPENSDEFNFYKRLNIKN